MSLKSNNRDLRSLLKHQLFDSEKRLDALENSLLEMAYSNPEWESTLIVYQAEIVKYERITQKLKALSKYLKNYER